MSDAEVKKIWERLDDETDRSYKYFCEYRDMGATERSIQKVADKYAINASRLRKLSYTHNWVKRATEYDDYLDEVERIAWEKQEIKLRVAVKKKDWENKTKLQTVFDRNVEDSLTMKIKGRRIKKGQVTREEVKDKDGNAVTVLVRIDREEIYVTPDVYSMVRIAETISELSRRAIDFPAIKKTEIIKPNSDPLQEDEIPDFTQFTQEELERYIELESKLYKAQKKA